MLRVRVELALRKYRKLLEISRFPVAQIGFFNYEGRADSPAQLGRVGESDMEIKHLILECMIEPIHDFATDTGLLFAVRDVPRGH